MRKIYGINPVREALRSKKGKLVSLLISKKRKGKEIDEITSAAKMKKIRLERVEPSELTKIAGSEAHQGVVGVLEGGYNYSSLDEIIDASKNQNDTALVLILDSIEDPQNMGALIRTAHCAGATGIVIPKQRSAEVTPSVSKASAGATEHVRLARVSNISSAIEELKKEGFWIAAVEGDGEETLFDADLARRLALVIGSEGSGIRRLVRERCDFSVSIPIQGELGSLNAAQAGAVALFEAVRQQSLKKS